MTKKAEEIQDDENVIYCVNRWTRKYRNNATLDGKRYSVIHNCSLSEMNDGHWEYVDHITETEDGTDKSSGHDVIVTNAETNPEELKRLQQEPWQKYDVYLASDVLVRQFEFRNGSWTALQVE